MDEAPVELGQATIVYEEPDEETVRRTVPNEHIAYFQDHWIIKADEDAESDIVRRIPAYRVYYVERSVEEFEEEVATRLDQVQSFVQELQTKLPIGGTGRREQDSTDTREPRQEGGGSERVEIDLGDDTGGDEGNGQAETEENTESQ